MDILRIQGGVPLRGRMTVSGAKNATLPLMAASLLSAQPLTLTNVPDLADVLSMRQLLGTHGTHIEAPEAHTLVLATPTVTNATADYEIVRKMRASILVLGPLLARHGQARVSLPGGCAIGSRPVDLHLKALETLGATIVLDDGYICATAPHGGLRGANVVFPLVTVTGTENVLMAASLASGTTTIINAAREPEVSDLARCLVAMGAQIEGIGTDTLHVTGRPSLGSATHRVMADRIEAGSLMMAAAITDGDLELEGADAQTLVTAIDVMSRAGVAITPTASGLRVRRSAQGLHGTDVTTEPFPGFPTDLQAQFMALMCVAEGASRLVETIFENRFMHVPEMARMGADISVHGSSALVRGVKNLHGAPVMATDLRASMSLVLLALAAEGESEIRRIYHLDRGYESLDVKLRECHGVVERARQHAA